MFGRKKEIRITIKLFGGLNTDLGIDGYDPDVGISLSVVDGVRLSKAIRKIGIGHIESVALFVNGTPAGPRQKLNSGDVILCMRPLAGG